MHANPVRVAHCACLILLLPVRAGIPADSEGTGREAVFLLHGLARTSRSMRKMKAAFEKAGYEVRSLGYPSTEKSVEDLANDHLAPAIAECQTNRPAKIHFVTHSLGAIVLRQYLSSRPLPNIGRIVMLGPSRYSRGLTV